MDPLDACVAALEAWRDLLAELTEAETWAPTGCTGWCVRDLTFHVLCDWQRALVALHTPATTLPDTDEISYWDGWEHDAESDANGRRNVRVAASMFRDWPPLRDLATETAAATAVAARRADLGAVVATQGRALTVDALLSTVAVEATVHHLDAVARLTAGRPGPSAAGGGEARRVLDGLAHVSPPLDDDRWIRVATGRATPTATERELLGPVVTALPLLS